MRSFYEKENKNADLPKRREVVFMDKAAYRRIHNQFCKLCIRVLKNEACDIYREQNRGRRRKNQITILPLDEARTVQTYDKYFANGGRGWIRKPRTKKQSTGLFFAASRRAVLIAPSQATKKTLTDVSVILVGEGGFEPPKQ